MKTNQILTNDAPLQSPRSNDSAAQIQGYAGVNSTIQGN